jgi:hypothetical protein
VGVRRQASTCAYGRTVGTCRGRGPPRTQMARLMVLFSTVRRLVRYEAWMVAGCESLNEFCTYLSTSDVFPTRPVSPTVNHVSGFGRMGRRPGTRR